MRHAIFLLLLAASNGCSRAPQGDWQSRITSKTERPLLSVLNPHTSDVHILSVDGKRFEHVRGLAKFYLVIPGSQAILFVTDEEDYSVTYHIYKMDSREDIPIHARGSSFGETIGSASPRERVEVMADGSVLLSDIDTDAKSTLPELASARTLKVTYHLDLQKRAVVAEKSVFYDAEGKVLLDHAAKPPF